jgi:2-polyprenyl-3-methyl-5-hydroxy-6-metoxy-1,4-benzoquinol methylase
MEQEERVNDLYDREYFEGLTQRKQHEQYYQQRILDVIEQYKTSGEMLEVGIGVGIFMELAHNNGWDIQGVEPSQAACQYVSETLHLPTTNNTLQEARFPENHFDVIAMRHVLEHITNPKLFLKELHQILHDDGIICLVVPNFGGLHSRLEKEEWFHLSLPYHVAHYTSYTLRNMLTSCGFEILTMKTMDLSCSSYLVRILNAVLSLFKRPPLNSVINPRETDPTVDLPHWIISKETFFNELMAKLGYGEEITVVVRKTADSM